MLRASEPTLVCMWAWRGLISHSKVRGLGLSELLGWADSMVERGWQGQLQDLSDPTGTKSFWSSWICVFPNYCQTYFSCTPTFVFESA